MELITSHKTVAISIVTWNSSGEIRDCIKSLENLPETWEIWVVDNNSSDGTASIVENDFPNVKLISNKENVGFAAANNQIIEKTQTDYVLLLNPDTVSKTEELLNLLERIEQNAKIGAIGAQLFDVKGNIQIICEHFPYPGINFIQGLGLYRLFSEEWRQEKILGEFFDHQTEREVEWFIGACMLVRREAINKAGPIPEDYFMFAEAMHWCFLMRQHGFEIWFTPKAKILHKQNQSAKQLPPMWRVEKSTLCKYVFCYGQFGWFKTKFIVLTDFFSYTFGIWRLMFRDPEPEVSKAWKMNRKVVWEAIWMSAEETGKRQRKV